jgi:hypothetical protein
MTRASFLIAFWVFANGNLFAAREPSHHFCSVFSDWKKGDMTPQALCKKHQGSFCKSIQKMGQAICAANHKHFCEEVKTTGEGFCRAGDGKFCNDIRTVGAGICTALGNELCRDEANRDLDWIVNASKACSLGQF